MFHRLSIVLVLGAFAVGCSQNDMSRPERSGQSSVASAAAAGASTEGSALTSTPAGAADAEDKEVTIPSGTRLAVKLTSTVGSDTSKVEDAVRGKLAKPLVVDGTTVVPAGAEVAGSVLEANQSGRVKGRASLAIRFDRLRVGSELHTIRTARIAREAAATKGEDAKKIGIGAGAGALIGAIAGGKKGALVGGAVGAGAGSGVVLATRGKEVRLAAGTTVTTTLQEALTIQVRLPQHKL